MCLANNGLCLLAACAVSVTIFGTGSKFRPVSNSTQLHTLAVHSYALYSLDSHYVLVLRYLHNPFPSLNCLVLMLTLLQYNTCYIFSPGVFRATGRMPTIQKMCISWNQHWSTQKQTQTVHGQSGSSEMVETAKSCLRVYVTVATTWMATIPTMSNHTFKQSKC